MTTSDDGYIRIPAEIVAGDDEAEATTRKDRQLRTIIVAALLVCENVALTGVILATQTMAYALSTYIVLGWFLKNQTHATPEVFIGIALGIILLGMFADAVKRTLEYTFHAYDQLLDFYSPYRTGAKERLVRSITGGGRTLYYWLFPYFMILVGWLIHLLVEWAAHSRFV